MYENRILIDEEDNNVYITITKGWKKLYADSSTVVKRAFGDEKFERTTRKKIKEFILSNPGTYAQFKKFQKKLEYDIFIVGISKYII